MSHYIIFITAFAQNVLLQHDRKRVDVDATRSLATRLITAWLRAPTYCWCIISVRRLRLL